MPSIRLILSVALPWLASCVSASPTRSDRGNQHDLSILKQRVQGLPPASLETALRDALAPKYQHGVFEDPAGALELVHGNDPELASRVVNVAAQEAAARRFSGDLRRRQTDNTTSVSSSVAVTTSTTTVTDTVGPGVSTTASPTSKGQSSSSTATSGVVRVTHTVTVTLPGKTTSSDRAQGQTTTSTTRRTSSSLGVSTSATQSSEKPSSSDTGSTPPPGSQTGILIPITISTTNAAGQTEVQTTAVFQPSDTVSVAQTVVSTNAQGQVTTQVNTVPGAIMTGTNAAGQAVTTTAPAQAVTVAGNGRIIGSGEVEKTTTDATGGIVVVTYTPPAGTVSELVIKTTRLSDGQEVTVTSLAIVGAPTASSDQGSQGGDNGGGNPQLVSGGAAVPTGRFTGDMAVLVGGVLGLAAIL